jgi:hypothetical protein
VLHQSIAGIFFLGAAVHCYATVYMYFKCEAADTQCMRQSKWLKAAVVVCSLMASPVATAMHPAATGSSHKRGFAIAGIAQYLTVGSYILFFGTYSVDFFSIQYSADQAEAKSTGSSDQTTTATAQNGAAYRRRIGSKP